MVGDVGVADVCGCRQSVIDAGSCGRVVGDFKVDCNSGALVDYLYLECNRGIRRGDGVGLSRSENLDQAEVVDSGHESRVEGVVGHRWCADVQGAGDRVDV